MCPCERPPETGPLPSVMDPPDVKPPCHCDGSPVQRSSAQSPPPPEDWKTPPPPEGWKTSPTTSVSLFDSDQSWESPSDREKRLVIQNRILKSRLIRTLEQMQHQIRNNSRCQQLLQKLLELRNTERPAEPSPAEPSAESSDIYRKYEALVKQNYQLEEALRQAGVHHSREMDDYMSAMQMQKSTMEEDWREERAEKERALALNAQLHQQVEQLQQQLAERRGPSAPQTPRRSQKMLPPPGGLSSPGSGSLPNQQQRRPVQAARQSARSVDEVLAAPYESVRAGPLPPPEPHQPVEEDLRRRRLVPRDSGYSDVLAGAASERGSSDWDELTMATALGERDSGTEVGSEWSLLPDSRHSVRCRGVAAAGTRTQQPARPDDHYVNTNTRTDITCPHCRQLFTAEQNMKYLDHVEQCPGRLQRTRQGGRDQDRTSRP